MDHQDTSGHTNVIVLRFGDVELSVYDDPVQGIWGMSYKQFPSHNNATDAQKG